MICILSSGMTTANMVYVSEISHKKYRPIFLSLLTVYTSLGVLLTTISKLVFSWRQTALFYFGLFSFFTIAVIFYTPESPVWLITMRQDRTAARKSLRKLYSHDEVNIVRWCCVLSVCLLALAKRSTQSTFYGQRPEVFRNAVYLERTEE